MKNEHRRAKWTKRLFALGFAGLAVLSPDFALAENFREKLTFPEEKLITALAKATQAGDKAKIVSTAGLLEPLLEGLSEKYGTKKNPIDLKSELISAENLESMSKAAIRVVFYDIRDLFNVSCDLSKTDKSKAAVELRKAFLFYRTIFEPSLKADAKKFELNNSVIKGFQEANTLLAQPDKLEDHCKGMVSKLQTTFSYLKESDGDN